ncbi:MAG: glutamine synthetase [Theionarchaea archaeon]|nr:glutamine synthetase [Theionarchaea archaeon]MBU7021857.1 glutamine synthetase [Theionarchaea archaeon]
MNTLLNAMAEKKITRARLLVVDIHGNPKYMVIPADYVEEVIQGMSIDGSSIPGFTQVGSSDVICKPDVENPHVVGDEAILFCDLYETESSPFSKDGRSILKRVISDYEVLVKPELEFFLLKGSSPLDQAGYMDAGEGLALVEHVVGTTDIKVERFHHENGPGQYEIEPVMAPAVSGCDAIIILKDMLKKKALQNGWTATFMPKPFADKAGSGMHFHILLEKNGKSLFQGFGDTARYFVGGLLSHAREITAVCNPIINSYKRLVPDFEAPINIFWGKSNRSALVRIPKGGKTRIEYRAPDPSCNPYLALALMVGAGLDGVNHKVEPPEEGSGGGTPCDVLPLNLEEALNELETSDLVHRVLGAELVEEFIGLKKSEIKEYRAHISQWEYDHYL